MDGWRNYVLFGSHCLSNHLSPTHSPVSAIFPQHHSLGYEGHPPSLRVQIGDKLWRRICCQWSCTRYVLKDWRIPKTNTCSCEFLELRREEGLWWHQGCISCPAHSVFIGVWKIYYHPITGDSQDWRTSWLQNKVTAPTALLAHTYKTLNGTQLWIKSVKQSNLRSRRGFVISCRVATCHAGGWPSWDRAISHLRDSLRIRQVVLIRASADATFWCLLWSFTSLLSPKKVSS
jgi:hypothetical protein